HEHVPSAQGIGGRPGIAEVLEGTERAAVAHQNRRQILPARPLEYVELLGIVAHPVAEVEAEPRALDAAGLHIDRDRSTSVGGGVKLVRTYVRRQAARLTVDVVVGRASERRPRVDARRAGGQRERTASGKVAGCARQGVDGGNGGGVPVA